MKGRVVYVLREDNLETSLVVQWLRLHAPNAGDLGSIPGQGTRSHILQLRCWMPQLRPCMCVGVSHSVMSDSVMPRTVACQAPLSMEFSRQEYWSGLPFPSPGDLPDTQIEPRSPAPQADSLPTELQGKPLPRIRVFFSESAHQVAKVLVFQLWQQSFQWIFRVGFL